jgi:hypothetical protein
MIGNCAAEGVQGKGKEEKRKLSAILKVYLPDVSPSFPFPLSLAPPLIISPPVSCLRAGDLPACKRRLGTGKVRYYSYISCSYFRL